MPLPVSTILPMSSGMDGFMKIKILQPSKFSKFDDEQLIKCVFDEVSKLIYINLILIL